MPHLIRRARLTIGALLAAALLSPTSKEQTQGNQLKKARPWRIGVSFGCVDNTWIVPTIRLQA